VGGRVGCAGRACEEHKTNTYSSGPTYTLEKREQMCLVPPLEDNAATEAIKLDAIWLHVHV
jgi:hypothetical protein